MKYPAYTWRAFPSPTKHQIENNSVIINIILDMEIREDRNHRNNEDDDNLIPVTDEESDKITRKDWMTRVAKIL